MPHAAAHPMHPTTNHESHAHVQEDEHDLMIERSESTVGPLNRGSWLHGEQPPGPAAPPTQQAVEEAAAAQPHVETEKHAPRVLHAPIHGWT